jgi:pyruvate carboxylase
VGKGINNVKDYIKINEIIRIEKENDVDEVKNGYGLI